STNWVGFHVGAVNPHFQIASGEGCDPNGSQYIYDDHTAFDAGVYQTVTGLVPGKTYMYWFHWGPTLHDYDGGPVNQRVLTINRFLGVDLTGGTDPLASSVIWGGSYKGGKGYFDVTDPNAPQPWRLVFQATGSTATFFLRVQNPLTDGVSKVFFDA